MISDEETRPDLVKLRGRVDRIEDLIARFDEVYGYHDEEMDNDFHVKSTDSKRK